MFIRGSFTFTLDTDEQHYSLKFEKKKISETGIERLPWAPLDADKHHGKIGSVTLSIQSPTPLNLVLPAQIIKEATPAEISMGLQFQKIEPQLTELTEYIQKNGEPSITYTRRFPRIPSIHLIQTFALKITADIHGANTLLEVEDLSPEGIMIFTEKPASLKLALKEDLPMTLEAKALFPNPIALRGTIRRIRDDFDLETKTAIRHLGIQFSGIAPEDRKNLMILLKEILVKIKATLPAPSSSKP